MSRVCPLFFASTADLDDFGCRPDRCAWAYEGGCAVTAIAHALDGLMDDARWERKKRGMGEMGMIASPKIASAWAFAEGSPRQRGKRWRRRGGYV